MERKKKQLGRERKLWEGRDPLLGNANGAVEGAVLDDQGNPVIAAAEAAAGTRSALRAAHPCVAPWPPSLAAKGALIRFHSGPLKLIPRFPRVLQ